MIVEKLASQGYKNQSGTLKKPYTPNTVIDKTPINYT